MYEMYEVYEYYPNVDMKKVQRTKKDVKKLRAALITLPCAVWCDLAAPYCWESEYCPLRSKDREGDER